MVTALSSEKSGFFNECYMYVFWIDVMINVSFIIYDMEFFVENMLNRGIAQ